MRGGSLLLVLTSCASTAPRLAPPPSPDPKSVEEEEPVLRRDPQRSPSLALASITPATPFRRRDDIADECERTLSWMTLDELGLGRLRELAATSPCAKRAAVAACAIERAATSIDVALGSRLIAVRECYIEFPDDQVDARAWLVLLYARWNGSLETEAWLLHAHHADAAMALEGGEGIAVAALENAARVGPGDPRIAPAAARIAESPHHDPAFTARLVALGYVPRR